MKTTLFIIFLVLFPQVLLAISFSDKAAMAYLETDRNFDIDCYYSRNKSAKLITPVSETRKASDSISRDFLIEIPGKEIPMTFSLNRKKGKFEYQVIFDQIHVSQGNFKRREFYIAPVKDKVFSEELETSKIYCHVNFAYAYPHKLVDGNYHFNVHPHLKYDWQRKLKAPVEKYLNDSSFQSVIFLEAGNYRGNLVNIHNFLDGIDYKLPPVPVDSDLGDIPENVPLIVSPAGNNRFDVQAEKEINITFSGGNHNYCIWNVTRHVLENLMNSKSRARVNFAYDTSSIVAQIRGVEGMGINFNRTAVNRSNLLQDLLRDREVQKKYHSAWLNYFRGYLAEEYSGMYRTYKINYKAEGFETSVILKGNGERDLEVNFSYL